MNSCEYSYIPSQVRVYSEGQGTLTPLERVLLDQVDDLTLELEEVLSNGNN